MRTRFCATMRRPACSIIALIAPVRLRAVASGLMIENVRSIAIVKRPCGGKGLCGGANLWVVAAAYIGRPCHRQACDERLMNAKAGSLTTREPAYPDQITRKSVTGITLIRRTAGTGRPTNAHAGCDLTSSG